MTSLYTSNTLPLGCTRAVYKISQPLPSPHQKSPPSALQSSSNRSRQSAKANEAIKIFHGALLNAGRTEGGDRLGGRPGYSVGSTARAQRFLWRRGQGRWLDAQGRRGAAGRQAVKLEVLPYRAHAAAGAAAALQGFASLGKPWVGRTRGCVGTRGSYPPRALAPEGPAQKPSVVLHNGAKPGQTRQQRRGRIGETVRRRCS